MENEAVISFENVNIYHGKELVLANVNLTVNPGEFIYLIGKTGAGKSTFLKSLYGEVPVSEGNATVCGYNLVKLKKADIPYLRRKIGIVFQDFQLLTDRSIYDNLDFVLKATGWENTAKRSERIAEVLNEVGLLHLSSKMPYRISGGEQQRLVIARSLLNNPPLIIADEPTGNLDPETSEEIIRLLIRINREHNTSVLMATHNYQIIDRYPSKIFSFKNQEVTLEKGIHLSR